MSNIFTQVQAARPSTNTFDLSHDRKMSLNMGELVPIAALECVPGDKFNMSTSQMLRMAPMVAPVMHRVHVYTHFFFVPNRILWDNWEPFITGGEDGNDASVFPNLPISDTTPGSLNDYMGLPITAFGDGPYLASALPFAAYQEIYNEYYRDQNLIDKVDNSLLDGNNAATILPLTTIRKRAWQHDYFTSGLPWTQKGAEATIPLGATAPLILDESEWTRIGNTDGLPSPAVSSLQQETDGGISPRKGVLVTGGRDAFIDITTNTTVDLSQATASSINDLRRAFKLQEFLEKNARGGSRYVESILSHFGVRSSDARLQRPEFLGGGSSPVTISEVLQTSSNDTEPTPQGNMAGHGISVGGSNNFNYSCEEHGYIIGIMSVMPKTAYQQGLPKHFSKFDKFDYFWPSFGHLGEQAILNKELYLANDGEDEDTFAYTPRYSEYKYIPSSVHGEFKTTLDFWHMGRIFENRPRLNQTFIEADPTDRIFAVLDSEKLYAHVFHKIKATRKMPYFGTPTF